MNKVSSVDYSGNWSSLIKKLRRFKRGSKVTFGFGLMFVYIGIAMMYLILEKSLVELIQGDMIVEAIIFIILALTFLWCGVSNSYRSIQEVYLYRAFIKVFLGEGDIETISGTVTSKHIAVEGMKAVRHYLIYVDVSGFVEGLEVTIGVNDESYFNTCVGSECQVYLVKYKGNYHVAGVYIGREYFVHEVEYTARNWKKRVS